GSAYHAAGPSANAKSRRSGAGDGSEEGAACNEDSAAKKAAGWMTKGSPKAVAACGWGSSSAIGSRALGRGERYGGGVAGSSPDNCPKPSSANGTPSANRLPNGRRSSNSSRRMRAVKRRRSSERAFRVRDMANSLSKKISGASPCRSPGADRTRGAQPTRREPDPQEQLPT